jgi:predicted O-methyltransferase YrrM
MQTLLTGSVILVVLGSVLSAQQAPRNSDEFRKAFLEQFHRTGLNTTPGDAMMLRILVESRGAKLGVEVGAASGFGAINMGIAFERNGGRLYSLEIDPKAVAATRENLEKVALEKTVTVVEGDALQNIPKLPGGIDFVFIDAAKNQYFGYLKGLEPKLKRGAVVVADNVIKSAKAMKDFLDYIQNDPQYETVIIRSSMEKDDGMLIAYKVR